MELSWLEDFNELARSGNFSRAAEARHLTQPAFSRRIRALEDWAGVTLFDRSVQPIALTDAGRRFQPLAGALIRDLADAREVVREAAASAAATLRFAATQALSLIFFSGWLRQLEDQGSPWTVHLSSGSLQGCETLLIDGKVQFLLCHAHQAVANRLPVESFQAAVIGADTLIPCAAPDLAGQWGIGDPEAEDAALGCVPVLAYSSESGLGNILRGVLAPRFPRIAQQPALTADLAALLKVTCLEGRGVAWLPRTLVADDLSTGRLVTFSGDTWTVPVDVCLFRGRRTESPTAEIFWETITRRYGR
jgi:LysR family transcriptional regulator, hypochlorite-specific transcription factor HypT